MSVENGILRLDGFEHRAGITTINVKPDFIKPNKETRLFIEGFLVCYLRNYQIITI